MHINGDFKARVAVHAADAARTPSPLPGVDRRMLDRVGDEVARATGNDVWAAKRGVWPAGLVFFGRFLAALRA